MKQRKIKPLIIAALFILQIVLDRYRHVLHVSPDLLYLVIVYVAVTAGPVRTILVATLLGWMTDYFSVGLVGLFGFSRVLAAFLVNSISRFLDLTRTHFVFLLVALSLSFSNLVASLFLLWIHNFPFESGLLISQPLLTAFLGVILLAIPGVRRELNVH